MSNIWLFFWYFCWKEKGEGNRKILVIRYNRGINYTEVMNHVFQRA